MAEEYGMVMTNELGRRIQIIKKLNVIGIFCVVMLCIVAAPLLMLGFYAYPSADDWSFGAAVYQCIRDGGNIFDVTAAVIDVVILWRIKSEPRFANALLGALQPGVWGERCYWITAWLMIGSVIISEIILAYFFLKGNARRNVFQIMPIVLPSVIIQLLYVPFPEETFYWWTGAVNYTFIFSISLILFVLFGNLIKVQENRAVTIVRVTAGVILSVLVGGDNYATSLSMVCLFISLSILLVVKNRKGLLRTLPITIVTVISLVICLIAPGNQARLEAEFGGATGGR